MQQILAALDLTAHGDRVFDRAAQLAAQHRAHLTLLHVAEETAPDLKALEAAFGAYVRAEGQTADIRIETGDPGAQIASAACEIKANLVVVGLQHHHPVADFFLSSVVQATIRQCVAPMLVAVNRVTGPYRRVLVATDFSPCARRAFHAGVNLAPDAAFEILHVYETPFPAFVKFNAEELRDYEHARRAQIEADIQEELAALIQEGGKALKAVPRIVRGETSGGIFETVRQIHPDFLAMGLSGHGFAALTGSRTLDFLNAPSCDLLVVP